MPMHEVANGDSAADPELVIASRLRPEALAPKLASAAEAEPVTGPAKAPIPTEANGEQAADADPAKVSKPEPELANG